MVLIVGITVGVGGLIVLAIIVTIIIVVCVCFRKNERYVDLNDCSKCKQTCRRIPIKARIFF